MLLLIIYVSIALGFSFLCSIAEAVLLSVTTPYISLLESEGRKAGPVLRKLKSDINAPLSAILTLNTIAHTAGAAGAGAQAAAVFGNNYLGIASAILTLLILVFSEIIPKTLGAHYWRELAPVTGYVLRGLVWLLYPFVKMSEWLTRGMKQETTLTGFSREEFAVMADIGEQEGQLEQRESNILRNLFRLRDRTVRESMTPRTVVFALPEDGTVAALYDQYDRENFSRIPIFEEGDKDKVTGFVLKQELLLAMASGQGERRLREFRRELLVLHESASVYKAFEQFLKRRVQVALIVDEYGGTEGLLTLEDVLESMLGHEIVDEGDKTANRQRLARRLWRWRAQRHGLNVDSEAQADDAESDGEGVVGIIDAGDPDDATPPVEPGDQDPPDPQATDKREDPRSGT
ncbi:CNNM domain-containing protein [Biformimicrobium ophioploci]|uniref:CNNM domain-containing protein n=1 Tax=Biformimicrobium ophioploci TaxID=3036711 RepID=A0ABQ6M0G7_9GAMM|nr:hemolysin family protein [Microbulbifer sp. NKW57]GMG87839.1 CNNM domain-containing protein [Microbulbifer sp. NKW57]